MMKKISKIVLFVLPLLLLSSCGKNVKKSDEMPELKVMTFNIRYDNKGDSINWWGNRKDSVAPFLKAQAPDLLGAQEVLKNQLDDLMAMLPGYQYIGVGRDDGQEAGEYSPIIYNAQRLEKLESGYFWLSETPEEPSFGWDAACRRIVTWARFHDKINEKEFYYFNTHFDHKGDTARINSAALIRDAVDKKVGDLPVVVTGDFNATPTSNVISDITSSTNEGYLLDSFVDAEEKEGEFWSFNGFGKSPMNVRDRIDYVFYKGALKPIKYVCFNEVDSPGRVYLSDHTPIVVTFKYQ